MTSHRNQKQKPGFVIIAALFFVMLASLIVMAVSQGFAAQSSRTRLQAQQTQLEHLLLAGRDTVLAGNKNPDLTPTLPKDLQQAGYKLTQTQNTLTATAGHQAKSLTLQ
jgi:type II secretory pathway pseudopilin PulG